VNNRNTTHWNDKKWTRPIILLGTIATIAGLALMAYLGIYNRFWADDWCYNRDFNDLGIIGTVNTYFMTGQEALRGYAVNRYSLTLVSGLLFLLGIFGSKITAILVIGTWLTGIYLNIKNLSRSFFPIPKSLILLISSTLLFFTLYISPQRFQILYWTAGIHYSLTIITGIYIAACITYQASRKVSNKTVDFLVAPLAFFAGGFSETGCAFLLAVAGIWLAINWYQKRNNSTWAINTYRTSMIAFTSLALSLIVLAIAPSNQIRTEVISSSPTDLLTTIYLSARFSYDFILDSIRSLPLPHLIFVITFIAISALVNNFPSATNQSNSLQKSVATILLTILILWIVIAAIQAPAVRFYSAPPDPRGKSLARFSMLIGLAVISWIVGKSILMSRYKKIIIGAALAGLLLNSLYVFKASMNIYDELPGYFRRAELWDERNSQIESAIQNGQVEVEVSVIDMFGLGVTDIMKSKEMDGRWISNCSSEYYGLDAIKAAQ